MSGINSTARVVHDHRPTIGAHMCLRWLPTMDRLCCLWPGHDGTCLSLPRFPRTDVSDSNPAVGAAS